MTGKCRKCGTELAGGGSMCILCYAKAHRNCPDCTRLTSTGMVRVLIDLKTRRQLKCERCKNERFVVE